MMASAIPPAQEAVSVAPIHLQQQVHQHPPQQVLQQHVIVSSNFVPAFTAAPETVTTMAAQHTYDTSARVSVLHLHFFL